MAVRQSSACLLSLPIDGSLSWVVQAPAGPATAMGAALALATAAATEANKSPFGRGGMDYKQMASSPMNKAKKGKKTGAR